MEDLQVINEPENIKPLIEEKAYKYQPTDENGRPIGGEQVIKYFTESELVQKLQDQSILLIRKLRQETKKNRLGIVENEEVGDAPTFNGFTEFTPRTLDNDERYDLSRKLQDPTTAFEAVNTIVEASLGASLDKVGSKVNALEQENLGLRAKVEANAFVADNTDYYKCDENFEAITSWMVRYNLSPVKANFQKAYDTLKTQGVLILGESIPVVVPVAVTQPVEEVIPQFSAVPSGLNNENSSPTGPISSPGSDIAYEMVINGQKKVLYGMQALNAMPAEEYKLRLTHDRDFAKKVDKLEQATKKK